jgi:hypothetical protein
MRLFIAKSITEPQNSKIQARINPDAIDAIFGFTIPLKLSEANDNSTYRKLSLLLFEPLLYAYDYS